MPADLPAACDTLIVGGAAIGASTAWHLAKRRGTGEGIVVLEKDPTYRLSASALSAASIRQQFSSAVNIRISLHGIAALRRIGDDLAVDGERPEIGLHEGGYLYLASAAGAPVLAANQARQRAEGADIALLDQAGLTHDFPWLATDDLACGTFGVTGEGWFDGWALLQAYRKAARAAGVTFIAAEAAGYRLDSGRVTGVALTDGAEITANWVVNAAGSNGARLAATAGVIIPVMPKTRFVFTFTCREKLPKFPLLIDTTGVYCRPEGKPSAEGQLYICGASPPAERDPDWDEADPAVGDVDWSFFEETVWPALAARVPAFEAIRPGKAWAGPYDMNMLDANAILGPAHAVPNLLLANGFSGHGLQQSPAVGRGLAEWITDQRWVSLDLTDLGHERIVRNRALKEANVI
jgi:FAD-dependent oxidoreductase domain-containing protein 1